MKKLLVSLVVFLTLSLPSFAQASLSLSVKGNQLINGSGQVVRLLGVNRSGAEYACIQGWGFWDGPVESTSIKAMKSWGINSVRIPLNEDCWLGINTKKSLSGVAYQNQIKGYVARLNSEGIYAIIDLHWNAGGKVKASGQQVMPDSDHSVAFWTSVAKAFKGNRAVVFDLYNEPHDISWACWKSGCRVGVTKYVGMQALVRAIRKTGARNPLMLGGIAYSNDLSGWLAHEPFDPLHQLIASFHVYNFNTCSSIACFDKTIAPVAKKVPLVSGEIGEDDCQGGFIDSYMNWADSQGISYLGWTWDTWDCKGGPALISNYDGTPTVFGKSFRDHLLSLPH